MTKSEREEEEMRNIWEESAGKKRKKSCNNELEIRNLFIIISQLWKFFFYFFQTYFSKNTFLLLRSLGFFFHFSRKKAKKAALYFFLIFLLFPRMDDGVVYISSPLKWTHSWKKFQMKVRFWVQRIENLAFVATLPKSILESKLEWTFLIIWKPEWFIGCLVFVAWSKACFASVLVLSLD